MRLEIPLTGTVIREGSVYGNGKLSGDPNDPIRPINIDLGNVSWRMVDIVNDVMIIDITPSENVNEPTGEIDDDGDPIHIPRKSTEQEKAGFLQHAKDLIEGHTKDELYAMSKSSRLKRPFKQKQ